MDVYVCLDGDRIVGVSAKLQGAELIRSDEAVRWAEAEEKKYFAHYDPPSWRNQLRQKAYDRMTIVNTELRDMED